MNVKQYLKTWFWTSLLMYFLYDLVWILSNHSEFRLFLENGPTILFVDLCYCFLFSLYNVLLCEILLRNPILTIFKGKKVMAFSIICIVANTFLAAVIEHILESYFLEMRTDEVWGNSYLMGLISAVQALLLAVEYYHRKSEQRIAENRELEMKLLKMQLNPHFIFNSLSVLASLISIDAVKAEHYVVCLSRIYRYILNHIEDETVSLKAAFNFIDDYVALLNLRYTNVQLIVKDIQYDSNDYILSQCLQVLVENAVKHNAFNQKKKLTIIIDREDDYLTVTNNLIIRKQRQPSKIPSHKLGLTNLTKRYLIKFNEKLIINKSDQEFKVYLPIIHINQHEKSIDNRG